VLTENKNTTNTGKSSICNSIRESYDENSQTNEESEISASNTSDHLTNTQKLRINLVQD
jgi:hypothetical protein